MFDLVFFKYLENKLEKSEEFIIIDDDKFKNDLDDNIYYIILDKVFT